MKSKRMGCLDSS